MPPARLTARQIADDLAERIAAGEYPPGGEFPSYSAIAELYDVSRSTAYRASSLLNDRGLVRGEPGRGTYVVD